MPLKIFKSRPILAISILTFLCVLSGSILQLPFLETACAIIVLILFFMIAIKRPFIAAQIMLLLGTVRLSGSSGKGLFRDASGKYGGFSMDGIRLIGFVIILAITILGTKKYKKQLKNVPKIFWLFISLAVLSLFWAEFPIEGLRFIFKIIYPILIMILMMSHAHFNERNSLEMNIVVTAVGINVLFGAISLLLGMGLSAGGGYGSPLRIGTISISAPPLALFLSFGILIVFVNSIKSKKRNSFLLAILALIQLIFTLQRMALSIFLIGFVILLLMNFGIKGKISIIFAFLIVVFSLIFSPIWMRFTKHEINPKEWFSLLKSSPEVALSIINTQGRYEIYSYAMTELIAKKPLWGYGAGKGQYGVYKANNWGNDGDHIRLLVDFGIFGWSLYILFLISLAIKILKRRRFLDNNGKLIASIAIVGLIQYLFAMITDNPIDYYDIFSQYIFIFIGLALAWPNKKILRSFE